MSKTIVDEYKELTADDYDTWLGKKGKKMSDANSVNTALDEQENRAMYNAYVQEINAQNAYNKQRSILDEGKAAALENNAQNRANTMRENAIMTERAMEYAQRRAALGGMANTGMSQTAMIDLYSQMAGERADAAASYDNQKNSIMQEYQNAILEAQGARDTTITTAKSGADAVAADVAVERARQADIARENRVTEVQNALADYDAGNITFDELKEIYEKNDDILNPEADRGVIDDYNEASGADAFTEEISPDELAKLSVVDQIRAMMRVGQMHGKNFKVDSSSSKLDAKNMTLENVNNLINVDGKGSGDEQDQWVNDVISRIKSGNIKDGTIIDMNYGSIDGQNEGNYFVYYKGKLYQTGFTYSVISKLVGSGNANDDYNGAITINGVRANFLRKDG